MGWNVSFDYCALITLIFFGVYSFSMRQIKSRLNTVYNILNITTIVTVLFDILAAYAVANLERYGVRLAYLANVLYFILFDLDTYIFVLYLLVFTENFQKGLMRHILYFVPIMVNIVLAVTTPVSGMLITITEEDGYQHGIFYPLQIIVIILYFIYGFSIIVKYRKKINRTRFIALMECFFMLVAAYTAQAILDNVLLIGLAMAYGIVSIYLSQYNTGDSIDDATDAFNKKAFYLSTSAHIDDHHPFSVIAFEPDNFSSIVEKYGEDRANLLLRQITAFLKELVKNQAIFKLDGHKFAILLGKSDKFVNEETFIKYYCASHVFQGIGMQDSEEARVVLQAISERFDHSWNIGEEREVLSTCICYLRYPEDVSRADEVNDMIDAALHQAHDVGNGTILYAAEYTQTRETYISELQTKQAELEEANRAAVEARALAEQADDSKTRFLANMSHEIRTPMNAIMGMTELVLREDVNDQVRKNVGNIQSAGNTLLTIINDILDFSKIEAGKMEVITGTYEVESLLNNVLGISSSRLSGKNLELLVDVDPSMPTKLRGDEMRLRQIIINLMGNAIKYTESGSVTLRMTWEQSGDSASKQGNLIVSVVDTGYGIKEEDLNKLFKSFSRIEEEKNHLIEGTGLGLSIVKRLLDLMDGTITVDSEYGHGSNFTFKLPQEIEDDSPFAKVEKSESKSVLIYSETATVHNAVGAVLDSLKVSYVTALSLEELGQALETRRFTHVFVESLHYGLLGDLVEELKDMQVVILLRGNQLPEQASNASILRQPFYSLNVAEVLNEKKKEEKKSKREFFKAPKARVLVVDDNAINIQILVGLLRPHGMQLDSALSGKECLRLVKENEYDLVLMDHMMPEMDGVETLKAIREIQGDYYRQLPVVVVTANAMSGVQESMDEAGFQGYISKPINIDLLEKVLQEFIPEDKIEGSSENTKSESANSLYIPGVNVQKGLEKASGKLDNYTTALNKFLVEGYKKLRQLEICIRDDDFRTYELESRNIYLNAREIGADKLAELAAAQEKDCGEQRIDEVKSMHSRFCDSYRKLLMDIDDGLRY